MRARTLVASLVALALVACEREPPRVALDLGALVATAEPWRETSALDLAELSSRSALLSGWNAPANDQADFLWSGPEGSQLAFYRGDGRGFRLHLRGSAPKLGAAGELVAVAVNGQEVGRVRVGNSVERLEVAVPDGIPRPGRNLLQLAFPEANGSERPRQVVAWRGFQFGDRPAASDGARAGRLPGSLELPAGTGLDFYVPLPGGARLALEGAIRRSGARLEADVECEGEAPRWDLLAGGDDARLREQGGAPVPCRISLRAVAPVRGAAAAAVSITHARLLVPAPVPASPIAASPAPAVSAPPPNVVIYIVDTLRADRLGCYGYSRPLTPRIDAFARQSVLFAHARAQSSWTRPTVATLLTGMTPIRLGVDGRVRGVPAEVETLPERLHAHGYHTAYVTANANTAAVFGFDQGVDFFFQVRPTRGEEATSRWTEVHAAGRRFLDRLGATDRFLLVLHTVEPHAPYLPTEASRRRWAADADPQLGIRRTLDGLPRRRPDPFGPAVRGVRDLYDAEVADTDEGFGDLLAELGRRGRLDDTVILFTADHGEELFEHGNVEHGRTLFEEQLRIPMIWRLPGGSGGGLRLNGTVDQLDVTPTVLELAGLPPARDLPGRSLARALAGGAPPPATTSPAWLDRLQWHQESLLDGDFKLIRNLNPRGASALDERLYDLAHDREESSPIRAGRDVRTGLLRSELRFWTVRSGPALAGSDAELDEQLRRELEALGYLN